MTLPRLPRPNGMPDRADTAPMLPDRLSGSEAGRLLVEDSGAPGAAPLATRSPARMLRAGCHLVRLTRNARAPRTLPVRYDGTLRVERDEFGAVASGDLYLNGPVGAPGLEPEREEPNPGAGIPVFARARYRFYVRVTELDDATDAADLILGFELYRYNPASNTWSSEAVLSARLDRTEAPPGYPSRDDFLRGAVHDTSGAPAGEITVGWVSRHLRRAVVEVDRVAGCELPIASNAGVDWRAIFDEVGWDVTLVESDADLPEPSGDSWSDAEMHAAMLARRDSADLDSEWRFWLLCVPRLDKDERGRMFDTGGADSNNVPREAAGIASQWMIPDEERWGLVRGMRFGSATDPYFRTAVHEIGHALGLQHNTADNGFMCPTDAISRNVVAPQQFPQNILWSYEEQDRGRLRHMPDPWVRPGGAPFGLSYHRAPTLPADELVAPEGLRLEVTPLLAAVPIGAPVRVAIFLHNETEEVVPAPADLSLKAGHLCGWVRDPAGNVRSFRSLVRGTDRRVAPLAQGEIRRGSVTLLRGADGALFPMPGPYSIGVQGEWEVDGVPFRVAGEAYVMVLAALDQAHAEAALQIISTPDVLLTVAIGGDHLEEGIVAISVALANDVLRPHFAYIEAKRLASPFQRRSPDLGRAADLIDASTVMSAAELEKAARLLEAAADQGAPAPTQLIAALREKAANASAT